MGGWDQKIKIYLFKFHIKVIYLKQNKKKINKRERK